MKRAWNITLKGYQKEFSYNSYGFRPGRGCKDALLRKRKGGNGRVEAVIISAGRMLSLQRRGYSH
ncbi:MAG: hypothetical protein GX654_04280 [Desulfatiglans sp.]|nr:hypothetical protein [Desulfatiglans sp.]